MRHNDKIPYNFGNLQPLPPGYQVSWFGCHEHYQGTGPDEWESPITVNPYQARRWCFDHALNEALRHTGEPTP